MSLNGLDAGPVSDAYYAAIVEVGGWFLLKYTNRDSVELLAKGKGGVHEARNELLKYEEKSPLYGLIIYRRRKVLIKFIPDGTSRLLQGMYQYMRFPALLASIVTDSCDSQNRRSLPSRRRTICALRNNPGNLTCRRTERYFSSLFLPTTYRLSGIVDNTS